MMESREKSEVDKKVKKLDLHLRLVKVLRILKNNKDADVQLFIEL